LHRIAVIDENALVSMAIALLISRTLEWKSQVCTETTWKLSTRGQAKASSASEAGADLVFAKTDDPRLFMDHLITHLHASARAKRDRDVP